MEHLRRLAGSSFEDPVSGRAAQGRTVCSLLHCVFCFCLFLQPPCEGTVRVQVMGELGECEGKGDGELGECEGKGDGELGECEGKGDGELGE